MRRLDRLRWVQDVFANTRRTPTEFETELRALQDEWNARWTYRGNGHFLGEFVEALPTLIGRVIGDGWIEVSAVYEGGQTFISPLSVADRALMLSTRPAGKVGGAELEIVEVDEDWGEYEPTPGARAPRPAGGAENDPFAEYRLEPSTFDTEIRSLSRVGLREYNDRWPAAFTPLVGDEAERLGTFLEASEDWVEVEPEDTAFHWQFGSFWNHDGYIMFLELMEHEGDPWLQTHIEFHDPDELDPGWHTATPTETWATEGGDQNVYTLGARAVGDPERTPREKRKDKDLLARWKREIDASAPRVWKSRILRQLGDGQPRTFQRLTVEMLDKDAIYLIDSPLATALLELVEGGHVEHTLVAPFYFRLVGSDKEIPPPIAHLQFVIAQVIQNKKLGGGEVSDEAIELANRLYTMAWNAGFDWDADGTPQQAAAAIVKMYYAEA